MIKGVCANTFRSSSRKLSSPFLRDEIQQEARRKSLGKLFVHIVVVVLLEWVVFLGGFLDIDHFSLPLVPRTN